MASPERIRGLDCSMYNSLREAIIDLTCSLAYQELDDCSRLDERASDRVWHRHSVTTDNSLTHLTTTRYLIHSFNGMESDQKDCRPPHVCRYRPRVLSISNTTMALGRRQLEGH